MSFLKKKFDGNGDQNNADPKIPAVAIVVDNPSTTTTTVTSKVRHNKKLSVDKVTNIIVDRFPYSLTHSMPIQKKQEEKSHKKKKNIHILPNFEFPNLNLPGTIQNIVSDAMTTHTIDSQDPISVGELVCSLIDIRKMMKTRGYRFNKNTGMTSPGVRNECLLSLNVHSFDRLPLKSNIQPILTGGIFPYPSLPCGRPKIMPKNAYLSYITIIRCTNRPLKPFIPSEAGIRGKSLDEKNENTNSVDDGKLFAYNGYDSLDNIPETNLGRTEEKSYHDRAKKNIYDVKSDVNEFSSFPLLVCLSVSIDGTNPKVQYTYPLHDLLLVESLEYNYDYHHDHREDAKDVQITTQAILEFSGGRALSIAFKSDFDSDLLVNSRGGYIDPQIGAKTQTIQMVMTREFFLWSLLQIHTILCTSLLEQNSVTESIDHNHIGNNITTYKRLPVPCLKQLILRNIDKSELQYASSLNKFMCHSSLIWALLKRQVTEMKIYRNLFLKLNREEKEILESDFLEKSSADETGQLAYDILMGNFIKHTLFLGDKEKKDVEDILNAMMTKPDFLVRMPFPTIGTDSRTLKKTGYNSPDVTCNIAEHICLFLQNRKRNLEAETVQRLISWEDQKYYYLNDNSVSDDSSNNTPQNMMGLVELFSTLNSLDNELHVMENFLLEGEKVIGPLALDCRTAQEEIRLLENERNSYCSLASELHRLLDRFDIPSDLQDILENPFSCMIYDDNGCINVERSRKGVETLFSAGRILKCAFDRVESDGGVQLRAVRERANMLLETAESFCRNLTKIIINILERVALDVLSDSTSKFKTDTMMSSSHHTQISKWMKNTQRVFQLSLLDFIKLFEVIYMLHPEMLNTIRKVYTKLILEGVMSRKRLKLYFTSLPSVAGAHATENTATIMHLKDFSAATLRTCSLSSVMTGGESLTISNASKTHKYEPVVQSWDIKIIAEEIFPVVAREAYFTSKLFCHSLKCVDEQVKKRNFETLKCSVDYATQWFTYYMSRVCGIVSIESCTTVNTSLDSNDSGNGKNKSAVGDPMVSLVASVYLNEIMDTYVDRQKKSSDHSLSLAYVRSTILSFRKRVDKQWVSWIERQIKWTLALPGVPITGKRAGIFPSFAKFPSYLDHIIHCCCANNERHLSYKENNNCPTISKIKVISYYLQKLAGTLFVSLKECAERDTTDKSYATHVMRMENSYFFLLSLKQRGFTWTELFRKQLTVATNIYKQSADNYLDWMMKRELKPLHTLFSNISRVRRDVGNTDVPIHVPRSTFERTLTKESNREIIMEKISVINGRMEKHLCNEASLMPILWKALVKLLYEWFGRWEKLSLQCYKFILEPSAAEVVRIAKAVQQECGG